ncbi:carboxypeptidase regulatory-like domain-containing protein [bacterium]|nr:MAG: carboxypeptidase regulatory-like domain-containing protein [bacterium]
MAEADNDCPHCGRDFAVAVARKGFALQERDAEPPPGREEPEPPPPPRKAPALEPEPERKPEKRAAEKPREKPRLEEPDLPHGREPEPDPVPAPGGGFDIDNPQAYVPGSYTAPEDSYKVAKAPPGRPAWHWLAMAVVCIVAFKVFNPKGPLLPTPKAPPAAPQTPPAPPPQPAAPVHVPGDILGAAKALSDAKDAAAAANTAAAGPTTPAALPRPAKPARKPHRETARPVEPDDIDHAPDDSIAIAPAEPDEAPRRRGSASSSREWRMRGKIFDLLSGEPVKNADVVFMDAKTGRRFATGTDAAGLYRATLPINEGGYDLSIRHPKYEPKYFDDGVPSYREQGPEQRSSAASDLMRILQTKEMIMGEAGTPRERDYVLIPLDRP